MRTQGYKDSFVSARLRGGVLIYVLILLTLISSILLVAIWANGLGRQAQYRVFHQSLASDNLQSGLTYYTHKIQGGTWEGQLYEEEADSIWVEEESWGLWSLLLTRASHEQARDSVAALAGCQMNPKRAEALYLASLGQPLMISGQTSLSGGLRLPAQGIQAVRVNGQGFLGNSLYSGETSRSGKELPTLRFTRLEEVSEMVRLIQPSGHSGIEETLSGDIRNPWFGPMQVAQYRHKVVLSHDCSFTGKILIISSEEIEVEAGADLEHVILLAPVIHFLSGFSGVVQAIASHTMELDSMVSLRYPSAVMLLPQWEVPSLRIGRKAKLQGVCAMLPLVREGKPELGSAYIGEGAEIWGMSHLDGSVDFRGIHHGSLAVKSFSYDGTSKLYRNTLVNARIDRQISDQFMVPIWDGAIGPWNIITWLP